jgi:DNA replication and repair protein RecF
LYLRQLTLEHFRNYHHLDILFEPGLVVLQGANAQGKTNLLEAVYMLATTKSQRVRSDTDLISWGERDPLSTEGFARVVGRVERGSRQQVVDIVIREGTSESQARKRFRLDGVERRAGDVLGHVNAVFFSPTDVDLIDGAPSVRRRYLDVMLCQVNPAYVRVLNRYNRVAQQRNALLRQLRDGQQHLASLTYWDDQMLEQGAQIIAWRAGAVAELAAAAAARHAQLTDGLEQLSLTYKPALLEPGDGELLVTPLAALASFQGSLQRVRQRELQVGMSLVGPHRDDLVLAINQVDATAFGSRGQQRTATLALKLAELAYIGQHAGDRPILLLDDATSELDERRRAAMLSAAAEGHQTFLSSADPGDTVHLPVSAQRWQVTAGTLRAIA